MFRSIKLYQEKLSDVQIYKTVNQEKFSDVQIYKTVNQEKKSDVRSIKLGPLLFEVLHPRRDLTLFSVVPNCSGIYAIPQTISLALGCGASHTRAHIQAHTQWSLDADQSVR
ncbi:hypothetical protein RRG08_024271 [Elysia crispata]|uniref:Uncharacterized protein n=1 Tax=Elysia crispata TaxID=231223 RepID=A0AAE0Z1X8_9GAST|nr:hypothetical protein RRG08_024271 [Elysia crispata]